MWGMMPGRFSRGEGNGFLWVLLFFLNKEMQDQPLEPLLLSVYYARKKSGSCYWAQVAGAGREAGSLVCSVCTGGQGAASVNAGRCTQRTRSSCFPLRSWHLAALWAR